MKGEKDNRASSQRVSGFTNVDKRADSQSYIDYINRVNQHPSICKYKHLTYEIMEVKPGDSILDVGSGIGAELVALNEKYSHAGRIVGIENSRTMIEAALSTTPQQLIRSGKIRYEFADAHTLPFTDETFDASRSDRTFQHLENPKRTLEEMLRVTKKGGIVIVADTDWGSLKVRGVPKGIEHAIQIVYQGIIRNPFIGRELPRLFSEEGLTDRDVYRTHVVLADLVSVQDILWLDSSLDRARIAGVITAKQQAQCKRILTQADPASISASFDIFVVKGKKK